MFKFKPVNLCDELGCTREWTVIVVQYGHTLMAANSSTAMNLKLCDPCKEMRDKNATPVAG